MSVPTPEEEEEGYSRMYGGRKDPKRNPFFPHTGGGGGGGRGGRGEWTIVPMSLLAFASLAYRATHGYLPSTPL